MKPITTSMYTFQDLIETGCLYVDKTKYLHDLVTAPKGQYFLARPRRFGKSLLISTLKAIFQSKRELFKGLAIDKLDYDWKSHPVIHLDMGSTATSSVDDFESILSFLIDSQAKSFGIKLEPGKAAKKFLELVETLSQEDQKVVILVDEYDKPLLNHIGKESVKEIQGVLKNFYSVIKTTEPYQRFAMITGVSKFSRVSIFSDLNNLTDLTMTLPEATLLGYTQEELEENFDGYIEAVAEEQGLSKEECLEKLRLWYNGYRFHHKGQTVYNPVSVMKCFHDKEFKNYWFETGTPTFLMDLLKDKPVDLGDLQLDESAFSTYEPSHLDPLPLLFQTGYLTIKGSVDTGGFTEYILDFPNFEVSYSFSYNLTKTFSEIDDVDLSRTRRKIVQSLNEGDIDTVLDWMRVFFSDITYELAIQNEKYYQTIFYAVLKLLGANINVEVKTSYSRVDAVIKTDDYIYVIEFKLNDTAEAALQQIEDKQYALPYVNDPRKLFKVGVEFSKETRNIDRWLVS